MIIKRLKASMCVLTIAISSLINIRDIKAVEAVDKQLLLKAQSVDLANEIGEIFNLNPRFIFSIWYVESGLDLSYSGDTPNIYSDLMGEETYKEYFRGKDVYKGRVNTGDKIAVGPFQYYTTWIDEELSYIYIPKRLNKPAVHKQSGHMVKFDSNLGFNRPHPLYLPDAMFNNARIISEYMKNHTTYAAIDERFNSLPNEIKEQILFIYAGDRYHGDLHTSDNYKNGNIMHNSLVSLYIDIYEKYGTLTGFFDGDRSKTRRLIMGDTDSSPNKGWTGRTNKETIIKGNRFSGTLLEEMSKPGAGKYNYLSMFDKVNNKDTKTNNRFGVAYGFEAMNGGFYYYDKWVEETSHIDLDKPIGESSNELDGARLFVDSKTIGNKGEPGKGLLRVTNYNKDDKSIRVGLDEYLGELGEIKGLLKVYPVKNCLILDIGENSTDGKYIKYQVKSNKDIYEITYKHLAIINSNIEKGNSIKSDVYLGLSGDSGEVKKPALGIQVIKNGKPINPLEIYGYKPNLPTKDRVLWLEKHGFVIE